MTKSIPNGPGPGRPSHPAHGARLTVFLPDGVLGAIDDLASRQGIGRAIVARTAMLAGLIAAGVLTASEAEFRA